MCMVCEVCVLGVVEVMCVWHVGGVCVGVCVVCVIRGVYVVYVCGVCVGGMVCVCVCPSLLVRFPPLELPRPQATLRASVRSVVQSAWARHLVAESGRVTGVSPRLWFGHILLQSLLLSSSPVFFLLLLFAASVLYPLIPPILFQGGWVSLWVPLNCSNINGGDNSKAFCLPA